MYNVNFWKGNQSYLSPIGDCLRIGIDGDIEYTAVGVDVPRFNMFDYRRCANSTNDGK